MSRHNRRRSASRRRLAIGAAGLRAAAAAATSVTVASARETRPRGDTAKADHAVFVQGDELGGNTIHVFKRGGDGELTAAGRYATGGRGGDQVDAPTDSLASQGSLVYDDRSGRLLAVNAGSGTVTSFRVHGQKLTDRQIGARAGTSPPRSRCRVGSPTS